MYDPCDNFYKYVCSGWKAAPSSKVTSVFGQHQTNLTASVVQALKDTKVPAENQSPLQKAAGLFQSCLSILDADDSDTDARKSILEFLRARKAPFVIYSDVDPAALMLDFTLNYGLSVLFDLTVDEAHTISGSRYLKLHMRSSLCQRQKASTEQVMEHLTWLGIENEQEKHNMTTIITTVNEFLIKLCQKVVEDKGQPEMPIFLLRTFEKVVMHASGDLWNSYMRGLTEGALPGGHYVAFPGNYVNRFLRTVFDKLERDHLRLWMSWDVSIQLRQMVVHSAPGSFKINGLQKQWEQRCLKHTFEVLQYAAYSVYLHTAVTNKTVSDARVMVEKITHSIGRRIEESSWLEDTTKKVALRKFTKMERIVGYPEPAESAQSLQEYYANLKDVGPSFIENWLQASHVSARKVLDRLAENPPVIKVNTDMSLVNALYQPMLNTMLVPAALLTPPFFGTIPAIDFGSVGHLAAHEMMHAFDVNSRKRDDNLISRDWWTARSAEEYNKRVLCLRNSAKGGGAAHDLSEPDDDKDSEMMSDVLGLPGLLDAYAAETSLPESLLHLGGLERYTSDQLFFVAFCYKWCSNKRPGRRYPDFSVRCNMPLKNTPEFASAFSCSEDSPMNPREKCSFW
uniref:Putative peptidase family m13 includes neprilysin n=1 Tax=Ixodes ricinus TaxID=34613 RepID=A0A131Y3J4_IXORI